MPGNRTRARLDTSAAWLLGWPLSALTASACVILFLSWFPHYLMWPWWPDLDAFATLALGWESGIKPYRDVTAYNFPGQTYEFWILGKTFGWGRTWPIYLFDGCLLLSFGAILVAWSRNRLGRALPGWLGFSTFLIYYLCLDYASVAQRDWHGAAFVFAAVLLLQTSRSLTGKLVSAALFAIGLTIRPQTLIFLPAALASLAGTLHGQAVCGSPVDEVRADLAGGPRPLHDAAVLAAPRGRALRRFPAWPRSREAVLRCPERHDHRPQFLGTALFRQSGHLPRARRHPA